MKVDARGRSGPEALAAFSKHGCLAEPRMLWDETEN